MEAVESGGKVSRKAVIWLWVRGGAPTLVVNGQWWQAFLAVGEDAII